MTAFHFDAYVADAVFDSAGGAWFALGDGEVVDPDGSPRRAHEGAILCAAPHPGGEGLLTGGDDGRVVWTRRAGLEAVVGCPGRWIDALAASPASGLFAFASGRRVGVRDVADPTFERSFTQDRAAAALAFDPKGRRLAVATYGGVALWYARIASQTPQVLKWAGSHIGVAWSPDGRFVISAMQENALHGWRLSDAKDMRMGGYPSKVRSLVFLSKGRLMATSGAAGAVVWPFAGADGPMGKEAAEVGYVETGEVTRVAGAPGGGQLLIGRSDGSVHAVDLAGRDVRMVATATGSPISALAVSADGCQLAWGDEEGGAGIADCGSRSPRVPPVAPDFV